jgi:four helix bundle protein
LIWRSGDLVISASHIEGGMTPDELQERTKLFAMRGIKVIEALPRTPTGIETGRQLFRAGTSVGANYRAARRGRSRKEFVAKLCIVVEEADESAYWLDLIASSGMLPKSKVDSLWAEAVE